MNRTAVSTLAAAITLALGTLGAAATVQAAAPVAYGDSQQSSSPFGSLGGIGGQSTARAASVA